MLSAQSLQKIDAELAKYPADQRRSAVMAALRIAQVEKGYLAPETIEFLADYIGIAPAAAYEVATFYSMYNLKPVGKYMFEVCQTGPCMINGSDEIVQYIYDKLGIKPGETTADGMLTLKTVECLGACGYAPMMQLGKNYKEHLTKEKIDAIVESCKSLQAQKN